MTGPTSKLGEGISLAESGLEGAVQEQALGIISQKPHVRGQGELQAGHLCCLVLIITSIWHLFPTANEKKQQQKDPKKQTTGGMFLYFRFLFVQKRKKKKKNHVH